MNSTWQEVELQEIADFQNGYAFKGDEYVPRSSNGKEVLRMGYIQRGGGFKEDGKPVYAPLSSRGNDRRYELDKGDIVIAMTDMKDRVAILGNCARIPSSNRFLLNQRVGKIRSKNNKVANQRFLYYYMNSPSQVHQLRSMANRGVQVNLTTASIIESLVFLPPIQHQEEIANILGTLDDKIELNRKTNETLEEIAKALFKSWFVDFDQVRAKAEGRPTGLPAEISDLFPDSFEDSELGEIPNGWSVEALSDIAQISTGKRPVSVAESRSSANNIPVFGGAGVMGYTCSALTDGEPILTTGRVGTLGVVNRVIEKVWISDNTLIINPGRNNFVYVYLFLLRQDLKSLNRGSTQPLLSQTELKSLPIARPPASVLSVFCELTQHWQERQSTLLKENVNIKALLDTLLPKLISGEIRIPDAEKMLEEVRI